jgi:multidrug transporter EmrE-like cation transporter
MSKTGYIIIEVLGWYGAITILTAYALVSFEVTELNSFVYALLNGTGSAGILIVSYYKKAYQPALLNLIWLLVTILTLI